MRVLFVTYGYPPANSIGGTMVHSVVSRLRRRGHHVQVLSCSTQPYPHEPDTPPNPESTFVAEIIPANRLQSGSALDPSSARGWFRHLSLVKSHVPLVPDPHITWLPKAVLAGNKLSKNDAFDVIVGCGPPHTALVVAAALSRASGRPWVGWMRDLWTGNPYHSGKWRRVDSALERRTLSTSAALLTCTKISAEDLAKHFPDLPVSWRYHGVDEYVSSRDSVGSQSPDKLRISYAGQIYAGRRDPSILFKALAAMDAKLRDVWQVRFAGGRSAEILGMASEYGLEGNVEHLGLVDRRCALSLLSSSDLNMVLMWDTSTERGVVPGKVYDCISAGKPVLLFGAPDKSEAADILKLSNLLFEFGSSSELTEELSRMARIFKKDGTRPKSSGPSSLEGLRRSEFVDHLESTLSGVTSRVIG